MEQLIEIDMSLEAYKERYALSVEWLKNLNYEEEKPAGAYVKALREFVLLCDEIYQQKRFDKAANEALFRELSEEGYRHSYLNPAYAEAMLGREYGRLLSAFYAELRTLVSFLHEDRIKDMTVMLETLIQIISAFEAANEKADEASNEEGAAKGKKAGAAMEEAGGSNPNASALKFPELKEVQDIIYSYMHDYLTEFVTEDVKASVAGTDGFAERIITEADLSDLSENSYLYRFGEWITEEELETARLLNGLLEEEIESMAKAYVDGYVRGFETAGKALCKKKTVSCALPLGMERFMRAAIRRFEEAGLKVILNRGPQHLINHKLSGNVRPGFYGAFNRQYEYDHSEDLSLFWGDRLKALKLQAMKAAYEENREAAGFLSGRAFVEAFGEVGFQPEEKAARAVFTEHQKNLNRSYAAESYELQESYIPDTETSFCIIAFPKPAVADGDPKRYAEIFRKVIEINTLPNARWQSIQQCIIDALDEADEIEVKGKGKNETSLSVKLWQLRDRERETNFENCLADVNIPVGEVFTSPRLKGTEGRLFVSAVYINGYLFKDLFIDFKDGRVKDYGCGNREQEAEGRKLIETVIFKSREALPMGEFAIGTNTAAYELARRCHIGDRMPILIAEKTGPHFAVGDTCYSHEEDIMTYNPDKKAIVARSNEIADLRHEDPRAAYFNVHTDITIPYDEIGNITAVCGDGRRIDIIRDGRFVLKGAEELNEAFS